MRNFTEFSRILSEESVLLIHARMLREEGGLPGVHQERLLGVLGRIQNRIVYEGLFDLYEIAAWYGISIAQGHPFNDANKRTAFASMITFLHLNAILCAPPNSGITPFMESIAKKEVGIKEVMYWLEEYSIECGPTGDRRAEHKELV